MVIILVTFALSWQIAGLIIVKYALFDLPLLSWFIIYTIPGTHEREDNVEFEDERLLLHNSTTSTLDEHDVCRGGQSRGCNKCCILRHKLRRWKPYSVICQRTSLSTIFHEPKKIHADGGWSQSQMENCQCRSFQANSWTSAWYSKQQFPSPFDCVAAYHRM